MPRAIFGRAIVTFALATAIATLACSGGDSGGPGRAPAAPGATGPSMGASARTAAGIGTSAHAVTPGGVMGAIVFPPRNEPFDFRSRVLESTYRNNLGRPIQSSFVDVEGTIVWTQEYLRYRVNGCGHDDAISRVFSQIDGGGIAPVCREASGTPTFPPRNEPFDFRVQLETKYRDGLRRGASQTAVDIEGDIVWTQEYLRYRVSGCGHDVAIDRVLAQIGGSGVQPDCRATRPPPTTTIPAPTTTTISGVTCTSYSVSPTSHAAPATGNDFTATVTTQTGCTWTASAGASWISILSGSNGTGTGTVRYRVSPNTGVARTGTVQVRWPTATAGQNIQVQQEIAPVRADFTWSPNPCPISGPEANPNGSTSARCTFNASASTPVGAITQYRWDFTNLPGDTHPTTPTDRTEPTISNIFLGCSIPTGTFDRPVTLTVTTSAGSHSVTKNVTFRRDAGC